MVFSSMIFLWKFLPIVLILYFICDKKFKNIILLLASLFFYAWGEPIYIILMLVSILFNYIFGLLIDKYRKHDKKILVIAIIFNLGLLAYFKYFNFFALIIDNIFRHGVIAFQNIILPIGISFYTFQILSYIIDLYRKEIKVQKNVFNLALYVSFFPQLIAGPIVKYKDIEKEISVRKVTLKSFAGGVEKFIYGLAKKVIIANNLAFIVDTLFSENLNMPLAWFVAICYTLQIYFDFSGYSDMAIGLGKMFGFNFPKNFNLPYIATSITDFWRRWHISLSTWFKQYLYIPLGGNRKGKIRTYINLFIVFFATGLWHGASYNFIAWGLYYGVFLVIEKIFLLKYLDENKYKFLNYIYVMFIVIIGWVLFRSGTLTEARHFLKIMFSFNFNPTYNLMPSLINGKMILVLILGIIFCGPIQLLFNKLKSKQKLITLYQEKLRYFVIIIIMVICISELVASTYNPFIYFRF